MDFDSAIKKHAEWRMKFRTAMKMKEKLDAATIGKDNCCELGKWLYGAGKIEFGRLPSYKNCIEAHTVFHHEAGKVAMMINDGKFAEAEQLLAAGSGYSRASTNVSSNLIRLKNEHIKAA